MGKLRDPQLILFMGIAALLCTTGVALGGGSYFYEVSRGPSTAVIEVSVRPEAVPVRTDYVLYGDGRLEIATHGTRPGDGPSEVLEWRFTAEETEGIVRDLVESGFVGFEPRSRIEDLARVGRRAPLVADGEALEVSIHLLAYAADVQPVEAPSDWSLILDNVRDLASTFPDQREFVAIRRLAVVFDDRHRRARQESAR